MRWPFLAVFVAGAALADPTDWPQGRRMVVEDDGPVHSPPALAPLAQTGTLYLMVVGEDAVPRCEAWTVTPGEPRAGTLTHGDETLDYYNSGPRMDVCGEQATATYVGDDLDVSGSRWFHDDASCKQAIAKHQAVGTDLRACTSPPATPAQLAATQKSFEKILGHGGTLYVKSGNRCESIAVRADPDAAMHGVMIRDNGDDTERHEDYGYGTAHDGGDGMELGFTGGYTVDKPSKKHDSDELGTGRYACICVEDEPVVFERDAVWFRAEPHYTERASCLAAVATDKKRAAWLP